MCARCVDEVIFGKNTIVSGWKNLFIGNDVVIGADSVIMTTRAKIFINNHVIFGPNVTLVSGDHRTDLVGKYVSQITDEDKLPANDQDIVFEGDNWIGAKVTILKGVTICRGFIIAAGSVSTKNVLSYSIVGGIPAKIIGKRFTEEVIIKHESKLK